MERKIQADSWVSDVEDGKDDNMVENIGERVIWGRIKQLDCAMLLSKGQEI